MDNYYWIDLVFFVFCEHIVLVRIFNGKLCTKRTITSFLIIALCISVSVHYMGSSFGDIFAFCSTLLSYVAPLYTIQKIKKKRIAYITLLLFGISYALITSCLWIARIATSDTHLLIFIDIMLQCILLAICIIFSSHSVFYRAKQYINLVPTRLKVLFLVSVWTSGTFALFFSAYIATDTRSLPLILTELSAIALIFLVGITWPFILVANSLNASYKAAIDRMDGQIQAQVKQYEVIIQANKDIRKFKHDFENLKIGLNGHLQNSDPQGALRFLQECEQSSMQADYITYKTGNLIADALLSEKQMLASTNNINIYFEGMIPSSGISSMDLCVILGNLLDNAQEACAELPTADNKEIVVSSSINNGFQFLEISNPVKEDIPIYSNTPTTSKKDRENHGIGLLSVNNSIRKYNGNMVLSCIDKVFTVKLVLDLNENMNHL